VAGERFDGKMQLTGILLHVSSLADVKILKRAASTRGPPHHSMDEISVATTSRISPNGSGPRNHHLLQPGSTLVLQNGDKSLQIMTTFEGPLRLGARPTRPASGGARRFSHPR